MPHCSCTAADLWQATWGTAAELCTTVPVQHVRLWQSLRHSRQQQAPAGSSMVAGQLTFQGLASQAGCLPISSMPARSVVVQYSSRHV
jgi:hypothetical protein